MKNILIILLWSISFIVDAQSNKVIYVKYKTVKAVSENVPELEPQFRNGLKMYVDAVEEIEYELIANDVVGIFKKAEKMTIEEEHPLSKVIGTGIYFTNLKSKEKIKQIELGEKFNVIYPYDEYKWEVTSETKIINGFKCYKAKTYKEKYIKWKNKTSITNPEVWFAPEIPYGYGPFGLIGLPGLILEATFNGKVFYYATKIDLDYKDTSYSKVEMPSTGKFVTEKEMEDIQINASSID